MAFCVLGIFWTDRFVLFLAGIIWYLTLLEVFCNIERCLYDLSVEGSDLGCFPFGNWAARPGHGNTWLPATRPPSGKPRRSLMSSSASGFSVVTGMQAAIKVAAPGTKRCAPWDETFFEFDVWEEEWDSRSTPLWFLRCDLQYTKTYSWMICMSSTCGTKNQSENHHHLQESIKSRPSSMICTTLTPKFGSSCSRGWCFSMHVTDISCYCFILLSWCVLRLHPF